MTNNTRPISEVTPEVAAIIATLKDPDETPTTFQLKDHTSELFEHDLVGAVLMDIEVAKVAHQHLTSANFSFKGNVALMTAARDFYQQYEQVPPRSLLLEKANGHGAHLDAVVRNYTPDYRQWYLDRISAFAKRTGELRALGKYVDERQKPDSDVTLSDLIDWLKAVDAIRCFSPADCFIDLVELLDSQRGYEWLIDSYLYRGCLCVFAGEPGAGKTVLLLQLLLDLIHGDKVLDGRATTPVSVCWLDYDANGEHLKDNLSVACKGRDPQMVRSHFHYAAISAPIEGKQPLPLVLTTDFLDGIKVHFNPGIIVVDPTRAAFASKPELQKAQGWESDSGIMTSLLSPFRQWAHDHNVALVFIHHFNKTGGIAGSFAIQACSDVIWTLDRPQQATTGTLTARKRLPASQQAVLDYHNRLYAFCGVDLAAAQRSRDIAEKKSVGRRVLDHFATSNSKASFEQQYGNKDRALFRLVFDRFSQDGLLVSNGKGGHATRFSTGAESEDKFKKWCDALEMTSDIMGG
jgi:hypothetical protein